MLGVCFHLVADVRARVGVAYLWTWLDWISHLDIFLLAVTLAYVVIVTCQDSYRYRRALRESRARVRDLTTDLSRRVRTLQSFATAAPYLGLAGTCLGILESFRGVGMQKDAARAMVATYIAASLLTTAAGLLVAFSAASSSNYLLWLIDNLQPKADPHCRSLAGNSALGSRIFPKYPLRRQLSKLPAFALIAAPGLAVVLAAFMSFSSFRPPLGLEVRLLKPGNLETSNGAVVRPLFIALSSTGADENPEIYLNSKQTAWDDLDSSLRNHLAIWPQARVYVEAGDEVRWAYVAMVVDSVRAHSSDVALLTTAPILTSGHARRSARSKK